MTPLADILRELGTVLNVYADDHQLYLAFQPIDQDLELKLLLLLSSITIGNVYSRLCAYCLHISTHPACTFCHSILAEPIVLLLMLIQAFPQ